MNRDDYMAAGFFSLIIAAAIVLLTTKANAPDIDSRPVVDAGVDAGVFDAQISD